LGQNFFFKQFQDTCVFGLRFDFSFFFFYKFYDYDFFSFDYFTGFTLGSFEFFFFNYKNASFLNFFKKKIINNLYFLKDDNFVAECVIKV
jgi:hypothetical protein